MQLCYEVITGRTDASYSSPHINTMQSDSEGEQQLQYISNSVSRLFVPFLQWSQSSMGKLGLHTHLHWWLSMFWLVLRLFGSAVCGCSVLLWVGAALPRLLVSHFDSVEGVVDGGAVSPAPGSWHWVVQHSLDRLHWETVWEWMKGIQRVRNWNRRSINKRLPVSFFVEGISPKLLKV